MLIRQAQRGDMKAFEQLVRRYEHHVYTLAFRLMGNYADASEAAQEAWIKVYTSCQDFRGDATFSTWLFRVVTNTCFDQLRRRKRHQHLSLDESPQYAERALERRPDDSCPEAFIERNELSGQVERALRMLRADYRLIIVLRHMQDFSTAQIAAIVGCSVASMKSRLHRARLALRYLLKEVRPSA